MHPIVPKIPYAGRRILPGAGGAVRRNMAAMKPITAPDRCNARVQRLAQVKFVSLPREHTPPSEIDRKWFARVVANMRNCVIRVIGCLEAARP